MGQKDAEVQTIKTVESVASRLQARTPGGGSVRDGKRDACVSSGGTYAGLSRNARSAAARRRRRLVCALSDRRRAGQGAARRGFELAARLAG